MLNFCTLFDSNYMAKGLCMYESLNKVCPDFHLYIFAFDDNCFSILNQLHLTNTTIISLHEFEDQKLLHVKPTRKKTEYCWTSTPSTILYCITRFNLTHCTYIDADIYFYSNPQVFIDEMGSADILLTEHRYTPQYDQTATSGKYCVQFMVFRNTVNGMNTLRWWRDACLDWCYARTEDSKFGDQKYLDDWTVRFQGVHELKHLGGGVAPWNVQQYRIFEKGKYIYGQTNHSLFKLVFYHFHNLQIYRLKLIYLFFLGYYLLNKNDLHYLYKPYLQHLKKWDRQLTENNLSFNGLGAQEQKIGWVRLFGHILRDQTKSNRINWILSWRN
jgi:hypothetical protein